jgi:hypothetical protein
MWHLQELVPDEAKLIVLPAATSSSSHLSAKAMGSPLLKPQRAA